MSAAQRASFLCCAGLVFLCFFAFAHAEDVMWNTTPTVNLCNAQGTPGAVSGCVHRLINPNISISYHVQITDAAGTPIACGSSVPAGTALNLKFVSHVYTDVYWFGTGFSFDSPYGEWRANGEAPPVSWEDKDYTGTTMTGAGGSQDTPIAAYRPLVVNPPVKSISGVSGLGCVASDSDGSQLCTPLQGGTYTPVFNFGNTYGYFYWRYKNLNNNIGDGDNVPLLTFTTPGDPSYIPYYGPDGYDYHQDGITLGDTYTLQVPPQSISCPITVVDQCMGGSSSSSGTGAQFDKTSYWLDTAPKVGGYSQNASVTGDVTQELDSDTTSITALMYCRTGTQGGRMDQAQFWVKDKNGQLIYTSNTIACKTPTTRYFDDPTGCGEGGTAGRCYESSYDIQLPANGRPYSVRTAGSGQNGSTIDQYIFDAYLRITEHKAAVPTPGGSGTGGSCNAGAPTTPTLSSVGQCTIGMPHSITMQSTDPDGDNIKYGIDWDGSGVIDQYVPGTGYVPSGSTQTASRTYSIPGSKTVKVLAQDENGNVSGWASVSFTCSGSTTVGINDTSDARGDGGGEDSASLLPDLDLRVIPSLVRSGNTTKVNWSSENVRSCSVTGENGDSWSGLLSPLGGQVSQPITTETTYTLLCIDVNGSTLTKQAKVRIIPTFQEK